MEISSISMPVNLHRFFFQKGGFRNLGWGGIAMGPLPETDFKRGFAHMDPFSSSTPMD